MSNTAIEFRNSPSIHPAIAYKSPDCFLLKPPCELTSDTLDDVYKEKGRVDQSKKLAHAPKTLRLQISLQYARQ